MKKRLLAVVVAAVLCVSLFAIPVLAADDYYFGASGVTSFVCYDFVPEGSYYAVAYCDGVASKSAPFVVSYEYDRFGSGNAAVPIEWGFTGAVKSYVLQIANASSASTEIYVFDFEADDNMRSSVLDGIALFPASAPLAVSDVVDSEMIGGAMAEVVSLLPIVLVVVVGFIGLRKGLSWLSAVLRGA